MAPADTTGPALTAALGGDPARNLSRLVCGRLLSAQTEYLACVVPTFEAGRCAGLGDDPAGAQGPAWTLAPDMDPVELPVYHHWRFATGEAGDFQSLALAIRGRTVPDTFGSRPIDLSTAGLGITATDDAQIRLGGALRALDADPVSWSDPSLPARFATALTTVLNTPDQFPADAPVLAPPRYGAAYRPAPTLDPAVARWYEQLNLDPSARVAAALGVQVVQRDQETLVASAWDQAADHRAVAAVGRLTDAGIAVAERMLARHLAPLGGDVGAFVMAPLLARLRAAPDVNGGILARVLAGDRAELGDGSPAAAFDVSVRRVVRTRGATVRRAGPTAGERPRLDLAVRADAIAGRAHARIDVGELATFEVLGTATTSTVDLAWGLMQPSVFTDAPNRRRFRVAPLSLEGTTGGFRPLDDLRDVVLDRTTRIGRAGRIGPALRRRRDDDDPDFPDDPPDPDPPDPDPPEFPDSADAAAFRVLAPRHLTRFLATPPTAGPIRATLDVGALFDQVIAVAAPALTFTAAFGGLLDAPTPTDPSTPDPTDPEPVGPVVSTLSPRFAAPMAGALAELGQEWLLPGLAEVPANTALALRTNSSFVQAFMIGLNHEFGRELLWREFPTALTATFFQRFWDSAIDPTAPVDLEPLADWADRPLGAPTATGERFVLLLRSELLRRFPDAIVTAVRGNDTKLPVFTGALDPDVRFFGFAIPTNEAEQWSIVITEQPSAPRFGLEVGDRPAGVTHAPVADTTSAALAFRLRQLPAWITIPVPVLMRPHEPAVNP